MRSEPKLVAELTVTAADGGVLEELANSWLETTLSSGPYEKSMRILSFTSTL